MVDGKRSSAREGNAWKKWRRRTGVGFNAPGVRTGGRGLARAGECDSAMVKILAEDAADHVGPERPALLRGEMGAYFIEDPAALRAIRHIHATAMVGNQVIDIRAATTGFERTDQRLPDHRCRHVQISRVRKHARQRWAVFRQFAKDPRLDERRDYRKVFVRLLLGKLFEDEQHFLRLP